jgi:hypothetical protein
MDERARQPEQSARLARHQHPTAERPTNASQVHQRLPLQYRLSTDTPLAWNVTVARIPNCVGDAPFADLCVELLSGRSAAFLMEHYGAPAPLRRVVRRASRATF